VAAAPGDYAQLTDAEHTAWALQDAQADCDIAHVNSAIGLPVSRFAPLPIVYITASTSRNIGFSRSSSDI
jgi:hypothetical protein